MAKITKFEPSTDGIKEGFVLCEFTLEEVKKIMETGEIKIESIDSKISVRVHDPDEITVRELSPRVSEEAAKKFKETGKLEWEPHKPFNF